jgi:hypothetical protein
MDFMVAQVKIRERSMEKRLARHSKKAGATYSHNKYAQLKDQVGIGLLIKIGEKKNSP